MKVRQSFIGFLFCLTIFAAALMPVMGYAQAVSFSRGQVLNHMLNVCLSEKAALAILEVDEKEGLAAAAAAFEASDQCGTVPVSGGPTVGKTVKSAKVKRGDKTVTGRVLEIVSGGKVIGYFFTSASVDERNS